MKQFIKKYYLYLIIAAAVLAVAVFVAVYLSGSSRDVPEVVLPSPAAEDSAPESSAPPESDSLVEINADTVKTVLAGLSVPEGYSREVSVKSYWTGGMSERNISVWVSGSDVRIADAGGDTTRNILISGGEIRIWYDDPSQYYAGDMSGEAEEYMAMIDYSAVLEMREADILDADFTDYGGEACVYVRYRGGELGYVYELYVSTATGLLTGAYAYDGVLLVYSMESVSTEISTPDAEIFTPPELM